MSRSPSSVEGYAASAADLTPADRYRCAVCAAVYVVPSLARKPLLIDLLDYIIGLGNITSGIETWRGDRVDPALVWLARHGTDTTT